jgi:hypothetical protein
MIGLNALISAAHGLWLGASPIVAISSEATCPTAEDVAARVSALLAARDSNEPPDLARVVERDGSLVVTLARTDGTVIGERALDRGYPCADLAAAAAVIVVTLESDVHPEFRLAPGAPGAGPAAIAAPPPPPPAPPPPPPAPPPPPRAPPPPPRAPAPRASAPVAVSRPAPAPPRSTFDVGAGVTGSLAPSGDGAAPALGALVSATWLPPARRVGARAALSAGAEREIPLGAASVRWRRVSAGLGPTLRVTPAGRRFVIDLHAEALAARVTATGVDFSKDHAASAVDAGLGAGVRLSWQPEHVVFPWLEVGGAAWLRSPAAYAAPGGASIVLPRAEALLAIGLAFGAR